MKNQYFGDKRDLFKYELLLDLLEYSSIGRFTFVPMLTPDDGGREGQLNRTDTTVFRQSVVDFFAECRTLEKRDIANWRKFFHGNETEYFPYRDDSYYSFAGRSEYFSSIPEEYLERAVVFFDPDVGLQTGSLTYMQQRGMDKYLFLDDVASLWKRADQAVFVIYQHLQNDLPRRLADLVRKGDDAVRACGSKYGWFVLEADLGFVILGNNKERVSCLSNCLKTLVPKLRSERRDRCDSLWGVLK